MPTPERTKRRGVVPSVKQSFIFLCVVVSFAFFHPEDELQISLHVWQGCKTIYRRCTLRSYWVEVIRLNLNNT